ncbi:MAG TPA: efflux RND transporter periplasmic adaptor subunit [Longimicrobiales bacterium]
MRESLDRGGCGVKLARDRRVVCVGWVLVGAAVAVAGACGGEGRADSGGRMGRGRQGGTVPAVATAAVETGTIARRLHVSGVVEPIRTVGINSRMAGAILSVEVEEGVTVRRGDVLARLDERELNAELAAAEAAYDVAKATFERSERLRERKVITAAEYDRDRAAFAAAEARLEQIRARIDYATIRAPISGVVTEKHVEAGDIVGNQTRLFAIADMDTMVVRVQVSELDVVELSPGDPVQVALDALPDRTFEGRIRRIFPAADPVTRLVPVEVALHGESARAARPGFLARVEFALTAETGVRLVPASAIIADAGAPAVFVVKDGRALRRTVETGLTSEGRVEIVSGLEPGELVVVAGNNALRDGAEVRVVERSGIDAAEAGAIRADVGGDQ